MNKTPSLLLASTSPRRRQLLSLAGFSYDLEASNVDESRGLDESPADYVRRLAWQKAQAVLPRARPEHIIIGADTAVVIDNDVLGKPTNASEASQMLQRLRGVSHQVYTGIAALRVSDRNIWTDVIVTDVPMRAYTDQEIERYIATGDPMDKAGAYGIQNPNFQPVARMEGCYASVMGLPLCSLIRMLRKTGLTTQADVARECQIALDYVCPVFPKYLLEEA